MTPESEKLLDGLRGENADTRYAAWVSAAGADPEIIPDVGKLMVAEQPGVRKAADEALKKLVHSVGKEPAGQRRAAVVEGLIGLTAASRPKWVRTMALRHLSGIGGEETVPVAAKLLRDPELQEEAVFCLERIPGPAADKALIAGYADVKDNFKPRVLAALGHRRSAAAAELCAGAMTASDTTIAIAGMKALGRIGRLPGGRPQAPDSAGLSPFQQMEFADSILRFADALVEQGMGEQAIRLYQMALDRVEEHLQCGAIIGLARIKSPAAAVLIETRLKSPDRNVRIIANRVWPSVKPA